MLTRREFLRLTALAGASSVLATAIRPVAADVDLSATLDPTSIPKYVTPLIIPPAMPRTSTLVDTDGREVDYYEIAVRQFQQPILPPSMGLPPTTVWSYGSASHPGTFNYPAFTIEAENNRPVRVKWMNQLVDESGNYLPHLLAVDQTLHWANPGGGLEGRDTHSMDPVPYTGPVPLVTHVHGAHTTDESDGYTEAWYLPAANNIPAGFAVEGTWYNRFKTKFASRHGVTWEAGSSVFQYPNDQRAGTLWYHDHTLGMTRLNVYAGPAGFYILRGGPGDQVTGALPDPAPARDDTGPTSYYEIPIAIQDRIFNQDASLFYPDNRAYFEGLAPADLQIPFIPEHACDHKMSDVSPIWNPEFFGNVMVVNGRSWPYLEVEPRRYRLRLLNGCNSRTLILKLSNGLPFYQIGTEGGFLPAPIMLTQLLMAPAERADVIVDFTALPAGTEIILQNLGPDDPFQHGAPGVDFDPADPQTTGQVMQFKVVAATGADASTPPMDLGLPQPVRLGPAIKTRQVSLNELESESVFIHEEGGKVILDCSSQTPFGPIAAMLGTVDEHGSGAPLLWVDRITENPLVGSTEIWEIHNFTMDAHPIHVHQVMFEVLGRENHMTHETRGPEAWELGFKDTVIAYPDEITRIKARFDYPGRYVWHCHIVEHEDNEMMRPFDVLPRTLYFPFAFREG